MDKEEIKKRIEFLSWAVKRKGRAYTAEERQEMKTELRQLNKDLEAMKFEEDLIFIEEFEQKHKYDFKYTIDSYKNLVYGVMENVNNATLAFVFMHKISDFFKKIDDLEYNKNKIQELKQAIKYIENNEKIPFSNEYKYKKKEEIQRYLSSDYKKISSIIERLDNYKNQINKINDFFYNQDQTEGFVYLTDAIFKDASNFAKGFSIIIHNNEKKYLSFTGEMHCMSTDEKDIPKISKKKENPDLIPFEIKDAKGEILMGYKNSNNEIIVPAKYEIAHPFVNGYAKIGIYKLNYKKEKWDKLTYGLLNSEGKQVLPCEFIELDDVYNDVVRYKKHIYKDDYVRVGINYDVKHQVSYSGFLNGFLILKEIKTTISNEIKAIQNIQNEIHKLQQEGNTLRIQSEIDYAKGKIKYHKLLIDFYLQIID